MRHPNTFFGGDAADLGTVHKLCATNFGEFVDQTLNLAVPLNLTRGEYAKLDKQTRHKAKRVPFICPAVFADSPSKRHVNLAQTCSLITIDIDDSAQARPFFNSPELLARQLDGLNFAAHTTASSTPEMPRVRILVEADNVPVDRYSDAVRELAARIGLTAVNRESLVAVQPMYLPVVFKGDTTHPLLYSRADAEAFTLQNETHNIGTPATTPEDAFDELDNASAPSADVTIGDVEDALKHINPDCVYAEWLDVAAALRHQFPDDPECSQAYNLFDKWSSGGKKYMGAKDTRAKWDSLRPNPRGRRPITVRSLFFNASKNGWDNMGFTERAFNSAMQWTENFVDKNVMRFVRQALVRYARIPMLTSSEEAMLLRALRKRAGELDKRYVLSLPPIKQDLYKAKEAMAPVEPTNTSTPVWARGICFLISLNKFFRHTTSEYILPDALDRAFGRNMLPGMGDGAADKTGQKQGGLIGVVTAKPDAATVSRPSEFLLNAVQVPVAYGVLYDPRHPNDTFFRHEGRRYVNTFVRTHPEADHTRAAQAEEIIEEHLYNLLEDAAHRALLLDFMAYIVQNPGAKIRWAVLLQGVQGCGKTFLAELMKTVLGREHVLSVDGDQLRSQYNDWAARAQLVTLEEVRVVGQNRHDVMARLKPLISNDVVSINQKYCDVRNVDNVTNYMLFTNHHDPLALGEGDRRYLVLKSKMQTKEHVRALGPDYFSRLFGELENNPGGLRAFLETHTIAHNFPVNGPAPETKFLREVIHDAESDLMAATRTILEDSPGPLLRADLLSFTALTDALATRGMVSVSAQHLASVLRDLGYARMGRFTLEKNGAQVPVWSHADSGVDSFRAARKIMRSRLKKNGAVENEI